MAETISVGGVIVGGDNAGVPVFSTTADTIQGNCTGTAGAADIFKTVTGDTGTTSASGPTDTLNIVGAGGVSTAISGDTLTITGSGGSSSDSFKTMNAPAGSDPVASSATDTLNFVASGDLTITGDSGAKSLTIANTQAAVTLGSGVSNVLGISTQQITLPTRAANTVLAGPTTGADAQPAFRAQVAADIPALGANPSATVNGTATNGSATTYVRSDGAPALANPLTVASSPQVFTGAIKAQAAATQDSMTLAGRAGGTNSYSVTIIPTTLTGNQTLTAPDKTGIIGLLEADQTWTGIDNFSEEIIAQNGMVIGNGKPLEFEDNTQTFTTAITAIEPTADNNAQLQDASGILAFLSDIPAGGGDVVGPASATDDAIATFDTTTGKLLQNTSAIISGGNLTTTGAIKAQAAATQDAVELAGRAGGTNTRKVTVTVTTLSASQIATHPDETGVYILMDATDYGTLAEDDFIVRGPSSNWLKAPVSTVQAKLGLGTMAYEAVGATGSFTALTGEVVTVTNGIITSIV